MIEHVLSAYIRLIKKRPLLTVVTLILYFGIVWSFAYIAKQEKEKSSGLKYKDVVVSEIIKVIRGDEDIGVLSDQVKVIFNSYDRKSKGVLREYGVVPLLEDAFAKISGDNNEKDKLNILLKLIEKQKEKDPYYGLKFEQEVIIRNLENELKALNASNILNSYVEQIKEVIRRQNTEIDDLKKSNKWGIPVGIAGVVFTVIFGIMGLLYPLFNRKKS